MPDENSNTYDDNFKSIEGNTEDIIEDIDEEKMKIDASFSTEDLLAIIAETNIDNKSLIEEIRNSNEMEGLSFNAADANEIVVVIVGKKLLECTAKVHIEAYEKVAFITTKDGSTIYAVPLKISTNLKNISNTNINPATEEKQDDIITQLKSDTTGLATSAKQDDIIIGLDDLTIAKIKGVVSIDNSTTTLLGIDEVFTGIAEDISDYAAVDVSIKANKDGAADALSLEWSQDGTNWDEKVGIDILANKNFSYEFGVRARYFRVVYTNGGEAQGSFRLQIMYHPLRTRLGARALNENIDSEEFAPTRRAVLAAKKPDGTYENIHATNGANLKISLEEFESAISDNSNTQLKTTSYHSDGNEGNLITGIDYVAGKSGIDKNIEVLQIVEYENSTVLNGFHYRVQDNVDAGTQVAICFKTPDTTKRLHMKWNWSNESKATITMKEGSTWDTNTGTQSGVKNSRRDSANTSDILGDGGASGFVANEVVLNPTNIIGGSTISLVKEFTSKFSGGEGSRTEETILKRNETYALAITSNDGNKGLWLRISYCEFIDKN